VRRLNKELLSAQKQLASQQREITSLNQKNKVLLQSTTKARADLREERKAASQEQQSTKRKFNELEERAEGAESAAAEFFDAKLEKEKVSLFLFHFSPFNTITNTNIFIHSSIHR
jgi:predicted  nucleic acid-binding Zn-ribbon protein